MSKIEYIDLSEEDKSTNEKKNEFENKNKEYMEYLRNYLFTEAVYVGKSVKLTLEDIILTGVTAGFDLINIFTEVGGLTEEEGEKIKQKAIQKSNELREEISKNPMYSVFKKLYKKEREK